MTRTTTEDTTAETLFVALELSKKSWLVAATDRNGVDVRRTRITAGPNAIGALKTFIDIVRQRLGLSDAARVRCCHEAGRDGFWIHRALVAAGIENVILDASSIELPRKKRRVKT